MGVRGLTTFFDNNPDLFKSFKLHDTSVIVDGNNLIHLLYFSRKVDCVYGGDYRKYAATIRKYFSTFVECKIKPIVIFDGGYDKSDRKFKTCVMRSKTRLTLTQHIAKYGECAGNVLPINAQEVFRNVLSEMRISFAQCDFEADDQVTALANHYKCPVLSDDSDFFIFDLHKGFIRLSSVDSTVIEEISSDGTKFKYLKCCIYYIDKFLSFFPGIDRNILPLFGTLVGNDFVNTKDFETFFSNIQLPKQKYKGLKINQRQRKIIGLLSWLKHYNLEEGVQQVLSRLKKERRERVKSIIELSIEGYKTESCNLILILDPPINFKDNDLICNSKLVLPCGEKLPLQFISHFHKGYLPSFFLNAVNLHRIFLPAQIEDISLESSYLCSQRIRQNIYGILLHHDCSNSEEHLKLCFRAVEEYDRRSGRIQRFTIDPIFNLPNGNSLPKLNQIYDLKKEDLQDLFLNIILCQKAPLQSMPSFFQLMFGSIQYWLKNCSPAPREEFLYAIILCVIYLSVLQFKSRNESILFTEDDQNDDSKQINSLIKSITASDALFASKNLKKYFQKPTLNRGNPLLLHIVHSYSQLQTCLLYISYLNMLLCFPFVSPKLHECFSGFMIYNLAKDISRRPYPELFVSELLGRQTTTTTLFNALKNVIFQNVPDESFVKIDRSFNRQKRNKSKKKTKLDVDFENELSVLCNKYQYSSINDESETDSFSELYI